MAEDAYIRQPRRTFSAWPSDLMSTTWPATRPSAPTALPVSTTTCSAEMLLDSSLQCLIDRHDGQAVQ
jgi:hypothetical protein